MSVDTKNKALLRSLALGMVLAGPLALAGCATTYDNDSSATSAQKATGEAEAKGEAEAEGYGEAEAEGYGEAEAKGEAEAEAEGYGESEAKGEAEGYGEAEAEAETAPPVNCPPGTTPQANGTCLQG